MEYIRGLVAEIREDAKDTRTIRFGISNQKKDRHGTILNIEGWQLANYRLNPIVGYMHNVYGGFRNDPDDVIGTSKVGIEGEPGKRELLGDVTFEPGDINPKAEKVFQKVLFGSLRAASVGFTPIGKGQWGKGDEAPGGKNETYYYAGQELLEWSIVNIPSNPKAIKKSLEEQKDELLEYVRILLGSNYNPDKVMKMSLGDILQVTERGIDFREEKEEDKPLVDHLRKRQLDIIQL